MTTNEKWNLLVEQVQQNLTVKEDKVQELWEAIFADANFFGYSKFSGEIDAQRKMHIGSYTRTVPDIIICDSASHQDLFVVELKQHNMTFNTKFKEQLFSYLRLLRLTVGVLICDKIYLYYLDYDDNETLVEIPFTQDNMNGNQFIELFSKGQYNETTVKQFIEKHQELKSHIQEIRKDVPNLSIVDLIKTHFASKYSDEEIELALKDLQVTVSFNRRCEVRPPKDTVFDIHRKYYPRTQNDADFYEEPEFDYMIIKTSQERVDFCGGSLYEATRYAWNLNVERARKYLYVFGVIKGIVRGVYRVDEWRLVTTGELVGRYEFFGSEAPAEIANRFLGKRIPPQYSKRGLASPVLYKAK